MSINTLHKGDDDDDDDDTNNESWMTKKGISEKLPQKGVLESRILRNWEGKVLIILKLCSPNWEGKVLIILKLCCPNWEGKVLIILKLCCPNWEGKVLIILKLCCPNYRCDFHVRPRSIFQKISDLPRSKAATIREERTETYMRHHKITWRFELDIVPCMVVSTVECNSTLYFVQWYMLSNVTGHWADKG